MTFRSWYAQKVALKPVETIIRLTKVVMCFQYSVLLGVFVALLLAFLEKRYILEIAWFVLEACLAVKFIKFALSVNSDISRNILLEHIDLDKFLALAKSLSQRGWTPKQRSQLKEILLLNEAQVAYLTGDFEACLDKVDRFQLEIMPPTRRAECRNLVIYCRLMCLLQQNQWEEVEALLEKIETNKEQVEAIIAVSKGEVTTYFDTWEPQWRLEKISKAYNQGRNLLNQDKKAEAKECFTSIVNENPDLFYVKEAKRYVEELS